MDRDRRILSTRILAVEGNDECGFFEALLETMRISNVQTFDIGGKDKFKIELPLLVNAENFGSVTDLALVRDAEKEGVTAAFGSVISTMGKHGLPIPQRPMEIATDGKRRTSVFIMPDNSNLGMLEDLCLKSVIGTPTYECVDSFVECFSEYLAHNGERFNESKARVQAFLCSRVPIANRLGIAAKMGHWDLAADCFGDIKTFLNSMFEVGPP